MVRTSIALCALVPLVLLSFTASYVQAGEELLLNEYFSGQWQISVINSVYDSENKASVVEQGESIQWNIPAASEGTIANDHELNGWMYDEDDRTHSLRIVLEDVAFDGEDDLIEDNENEEVENVAAIATALSTRRGFFYYSPEEVDDQDPDAPVASKLLFAFDFEAQASSSLYSSGFWMEDDRELFYQFFITSPLSFLVNVFDAEHQTVRTLFGKKEPIEKEQTFFQKYGTMMMMMGVMLVMQYMKRQAPQAEGEAPPAAPAPAAN